MAPDFAKIFFDGGPVMILVALATLAWVAAMVVCLLWKWPYAKRLAVMAVFPLAFVILGALKAALNEHAAALYGIRYGLVDPGMYYEDLLAASRSSMMILAMAGLSMLVFVVGCFLPLGAEKK
jgi:hypothetical protein